MAQDSSDPFSDLGGQATGNASLPRDTPITATERLIAQNLFDTQPARRAAYLKRIGLEIDPSDDNRYRPLGSSEGFHSEIDPGFIDTFKKGGWSGLMAETAKDFGDIAYDTAEGAGLAEAAAGGGATGAATGAIGGPAGAAGGAILGAIAGGALGKAASELAKKQVGDLMLDESVPVDKQALILQSLMSGVAPEVFKGIGKAGKAGVLKLLETRQESLANAAKAAGGMTDELVARAVAEPEMFSKEATKGATERLVGFAKDILGIDPDKPFTTKSTRQIGKNSVLGRIAAPLNEAADVELDRLGKTDAANWTRDELLAPFRNAAQAIEDKKLSARTEDDRAALEYFRKKIGEVTSDYAPDEKINFKAGRDILKAAQDDAFNREIPGSTSLKQAIGKNGLRGAADEKAARAYQKLAIDGDVIPLEKQLQTINAQRSKVLSAAEDVQKNLTPSKVTKAFIGGDTDAKVETRRALGMIDDLARESGLPELQQLNYTKAIEDGNAQRLVEGMYQNPKFASGNANTSIVKGAISEGLKYGGIGGGVGLGLGGAPGGAIGAKAGFVAGALKGGFEAADNAHLQNIFPKLGELADQKLATEALAPEKLTSGLLQQKLGDSLPARVVGLGAQGAEALARQQLALEPGRSEFVQGDPATAASRIEKPVADKDDPFSDL